MRPEARGLYLGGGVCWRQVGHESAVPGQDDCLLHQGMGGNGLLDLSQLYPKTPNLHLKVNSAEELDAAVGPVARQVPRLVHPAAVVTVRVRDEPLSRQFGPAMVPNRHLHATDVQLPSYAHRDHLQARVEDVQLCVGDGLPDWHRRQLAVRRALPRCHVNGRLGRAVQVVQFDVVHGSEEPVLQLEGKRLSRADSPPQRRRTPRRLGFVQEDGQHAGHEVAGRDAGRHYQVRQVVGLAMAARLRNDDLGANHQWPEELPHRDIKAEGRLLQHSVALRQPIGVLHPEQPVDDPPV
mmetsp:Transcript_27830/g.80108  ORF Transcript_27830/g.80108 Transcript_27830/m.80108 type:complete len:295 (-) Transcript_27830:530-1414(-)